MATMRRDNGAGSVYFDHRTGSTCRDALYHKTCTDRWSASISKGTDGTGKRVRVRLTDRTRSGLLEKIEQARKDTDNGLTASKTYTVADALDAFLRVGLGPIPGAAVCDSGSRSWAELARTPKYSPRA
jgi:hypothetical protein